MQYSWKAGNNAETMSSTALSITASSADSKGSANGVGDSSGWWQ